VRCFTPRRLAAEQTAHPKQRPAQAAGYHLKSLHSNRRRAKIIEVVRIAQAMANVSAAMFASTMESISLGAAMGIIDSIQRQWIQRASAPDRYRASAGADDASACDYEDDGRNLLTPSQSVDGVHCHPKEAAPPELAPAGGAHVLKTARCRAP
jgi:hypothetical protein